MIGPATGSGSRLAPALWRPVAVVLAVLAPPVASGAAAKSPPVQPMAAPAPSAAASPSAPSQLSQLFHTVQRLQQEVNLLRGQVEDQAHRLERLGREQQERYLDIDRRLAGAQSAPATALGDAGPSVPSGTLTPASGAEPTTEQGAYQAAYALLERSEYPAAAQAMERLIEDYPNGEYTANAFYWLAELHRRNGDLENARQALVQVITLYPEHGKVPDALFKAGVVYVELDDAERARGYLEQVVREHPNSTAASLAKDYLAELQ